MNEVSTFRLYLLRAIYLLMVVGLAIDIWPDIISPPANLSHMAGVVRAVLGGVSLLALLGLRYPVKMLPLLYFELIWKLIWVLAFGVPHWLDGTLDEATRGSLFDCSLGIVLVPLVIPWGYTLRNFVKAPADRWRTAT